MNTTYEERLMKIMVAPVGEATFSELSTFIEIVDEAAGEFVRVEQEDGAVNITPEEWPAVRAAIDRMIGLCREQKEEGAK